MNQKLTHTPHTERKMTWEGLVNVKKSDIPYFLEQPPISPTPLFLLGKIWTPPPFSENFENSNPSPFIKGGGSNYEDLI